MRGKPLQALAQSQNEEKEEPVKKEDVANTPLKKKREKRRVDESCITVNAQGGGGKRKAGGLESAGCGLKTEILKPEEIGKGKKGKWGLHQSPA